jgi:formylglycine-generating enzyme required for sulfatase activity
VGSAVSFEMVAIPGGSYIMGSPESEPFRLADEGPAREVKIDPFFMGKIEVSWGEYLAFFKQTGRQGKTTDAFLQADLADVDAISGPTPPYGAPDQGWGKGTMPAMSMTPQAAEVYCQWLSKITGKTYRLPTEAEWEYAARGGSSTPYFFEGDPKRYVRKGIRNKLFGIDTSGINSYVNYAENSMARTANPGEIQENPFGLVNMLGNVAEFCSDWYSADTYASYAEGVVSNPTGPAEGEERVIRGGSYRDGADRVRSAARDFTRTDDWLKTDPQIPKSIWWYSDCFHVGFRVVCEYSEPLNE